MPPSSATSGVRSLVAAIRSTTGIMLESRREFGISPMQNNMSSKKVDHGLLRFKANNRPAHYIPRNIGFQDCLFLFSISLVSGISYVARLGFYADDWYVLAIFRSAKDQSLIGLLRSLPGLLPKGLGVRPVEALYQAYTYTIFRLHPLPYHVCNALVLATTAVLFYASLRELLLPHCITLTV